MYSLSHYYGRRFKEVRCVIKEEEKQGKEEREKERKKDLHGKVWTNQYPSS